ncbi:outer membrane beta-barrel protein [Fibrobacter sp. UWEL]|uniref:outer membrane beta-barrel protein n=1 Tax=Fibrobacter sp. UWEL TaxID=1896209 RepID=UPI0009220F52|nr:outer membrane beta-barrel protein [Fibrobacter sp. UWEL]SHK35855.1 Outer membrane protein beta-barrel domain-containing protein [Fibrobacter sp. UWEL]
MKKSLISAIALACTMVVAANAQDDYEDYAYEEGVAESAPESDSDYSTAKSSYSSEVTKSEEVPVAMELPGQNASEKPKNRLGFHLGMGFSGTYGNEKAAGYYYNPTTDKFYVGEEDPFAGYLGLNFDLGLMYVFFVNSKIAIAPEFNFRVIDYFKESDIYYAKVYDDYWHRTTYEPVDENMMLFDIAIPVMGRFYAAKNFYAEAGVQFNLNLAGSFTLDNAEYDYSEDVGDWAGESFGVSLNFGGGASFNAKDGGLIELGVRFMLDLTRLEADEKVNNEANGSYRDAVATKGWHIQFVCNYLL